MSRTPHTRVATRAARAAGAVVVPSVCAGAVAAPAQAAPSRTPVQASTVACAAPSDSYEFGAAVVQLTFKKGSLAKDDFLVVVPVNDDTGLDAGERVSVDRRQTQATVVIPADGRALTPAATVQVRLGGDVVQTITVSGGCGALDADPAQAPAIGTITTGPAA